MNAGPYGPEQRRPEAFWGVLSPVLHSLALGAQRLTAVRGLGEMLPSSVHCLQ